MNKSKVWTSKLSLAGQAWLVEILTTKPKRTYYYGPFATAYEAARSIVGYVEDLEDESAQGIQTQVKRLQPYQLTIDDEYVN